MSFGKTNLLRKKEITAEYKEGFFLIKVKFEESETSFALDVIFDREGVVNEISIDLQRAPFEKCMELMNCIELFKGIKVKKGLFDEIKRISQGKGCSVVEWCFHDSANAFALLSSFFQESIILRDCYAWRR